MSRRPASIRTSSRQDGDTLIEWAKAMTKRDGDKVTRSGIMMTGSGVQPTVTWGIVAGADGLPARQRRSTRPRRVNPEAGKPAMQWVLDLFDKCKVSTRDVTDRYKAFGTGQGSIFWTGPWTLNGYVQQKLNFRTYASSRRSAERSSPISRWAAWNSTCRRTRAATRPRMQAVKWLSDNSFLWTTKGRGASPAEVDPRTIRTTRPPACPGIVRGAFVEGMRLRDAEPGRDPRPGGAGLHHLRRRQLPGQDARRGVGQAEAIDEAMASIQDAVAEGSRRGLSVARHRVPPRRRCRSGAGVPD